jgi:hypothetical protein
MGLEHVKEMREKSELARGRSDMLQVHSKRLFNVVVGNADLEIKPKFLQPSSPTCHIAPAYATYFQVSPVSYHYFF